jgi:hypothetical protein
MGSHPAPATGGTSVNPDLEDMRDFAFYFTLGEFLEQAIVHCEAAMNSSKEIDLRVHLGVASRALRAALQIFLERQEASHARKRL